MSESHESASLVKTLRPFHVWALGVEIVLVGEYMGWNFTVAKEEILDSLLATLVAGTMLTLIDCNFNRIKNSHGLSLIH